MQPALKNTPGPGQQIEGAGPWLMERLRDAVRWPVALVMRFPERAGRVARTLQEGILPPALQSALVQAWLQERHSATPSAERVLRPLLRPAILLSQLFDLVAGPELGEFFLRALTRASHLTNDERAAAADLLGANALRWDEVRVAQGGLLGLIFSLNGGKTVDGGRAFTAWHTINLPSRGPHTRAHRDILIHELVHVFQFERVGSRYLIEAVYAQCSVGYCYDELEQLPIAREQGGLSYCLLNREQQAQFVQDLYNRKQAAAGGKAAPYLEAFVKEMRAGQV